MALALARMAGIRQTVEQFLGTEPGDRGISPGILAETLVAAILCGCRPLYKVETFWKNRAVGIFYEGENITTDRLNDDAYARMLDRLSAVNCPRLFETVCLKMLQHHSLNVTLAHSDTTSVSVEGVYDGQDPENPLLTFGHSKDRRPDLKQLKMGLSVQEQGLPLSGEVLAGNTSDQVWNPEAVQGLSKLLSEGGCRDAIFLADCALVSTASLKKLSRERISFISRLPETFGIAGELKDAAWEENRWEELGTLAEKETKKAAGYKVCSYRRPIDGQEFVFVVVHSTNPEERKEKTLTKALERTCISLRKQAVQLAKTKYACEADASAAGEKLQEAVRAEGFACRCKVMRREELRYEGRGRPKAGAPVAVRAHWQVEVEFGEVDADFLEEKRRHAATFVLVCHLEKELSAREILQSYKNQDKVERGFRFLKQPQYLGPVYTKKESRVEALGYIFLMVLLLAKYLEYHVHLGMAESGEVLKVGGQKTPHPSAKMVLEFLCLMTVLEIGGQLSLPANTDESALKLLRWMGLEERIYTNGLPSDPFHGN